MLSSPIQLPAVDECLEFELLAWKVFHLGNFSIFKNISLAWCFISTSFICFKKSKSKAECLNPYNSLQLPNSSISHFFDWLHISKFTTLINFFNSNCVISVVYQQLSWFYLLAFHSEVFHLVYQFCHIFYLLAWTNRGVSYTLCFIYRGKLCRGYKIPLPDTPWSYFHANQTRVIF